MLRRATAADAPAAAQLIAAALAEHGLPFEPAGRDADVAAFGARPDNDDLVAEEAASAARDPAGAAEGRRRVLGVVSVGPQGAERRAWVSKLFVARDARRRGVGRALLDAAHEAARARGYREVGLRTRVIFREAIALYDSSGYAGAGAASSSGTAERGAPGGDAGAGDLVLYRTL